MLDPIPLVNWWPEASDILPDFTWIKGAVIGLFLAILGLAAFKFMPGLLLKLIVGGVLLILGLLLLLGYIQLSDIGLITTLGGI